MFLGKALLHVCSQVRVMTIITFYLLLQYVLGLGQSPFFLIHSISPSVVAVHPFPLPLLFFPPSLYSSPSPSLISHKVLYKESDSVQTTTWHTDLQWVVHHPSHCSRCQPGLAPHASARLTAVSTLPVAHLMEGHDSLCYNNFSLEKSTDSLVSNMTLDTFLPYNPVFTCCK